MSTSEELKAQMEAETKERAVRCKKRIDQVLEEENCVLAISRNEIGVGTETTVTFNTFIVAK